MQSDPRKLLFDTKQTMPSRPCKRSVAQRKNFTYGSDSLLPRGLRILGVRFPDALSITSYFRFLLLSFSFCWFMLYGGLPIITVIGALALALHALRVLLRHEPEVILAAFGQVERIHEAQPFERLIACRSIRNRRARY